MLPELLFTVGSSMQDIPRDDFVLLNGDSTTLSCDKDTLHHHQQPNQQPIHHHHLHHQPLLASHHHLHLHLANNSSSSSNSIANHPSPHVHLHHHLHQLQQQQQHSQNDQLHQQQHHLITGTDCTLQPVKLGRRTPSDLDGLTTVGAAANGLPIALTNATIKSEESEHIYPLWHTLPTASGCTDIGSNLLCNSDDPLISGAIDDNQNEFHQIHNHHQHQQHNNHPSNQQSSSQHVSLHSSGGAGCSSGSVSCSLIKAEEPTLSSHHPNLLHAQHSHHLHPPHHHSLSDISPTVVTSFHAAVGAHFIEHPNRSQTPNASTTRSPPKSARAAPKSRTSTSTTAVESSIADAVESLPASGGRKRSAAAAGGTATARTRRKGQLKLRFHHQALPQEYLDHYEATQDSQQRRDAAKAVEAAAKVASRHQPSTPSNGVAMQHVQQAHNNKLTSSANTSVSHPNYRTAPPNNVASSNTADIQPNLRRTPRAASAIATVAAATSPSRSALNSVAVVAGTDDAAQVAARAHDSVRNWLQKISEFQQIDGATDETTSAALSVAAVHMKTEPTRSAATTRERHSNSGAGVGSAPTTRIVSYNDLPFMGEMTLDNSKPRRGRKPKKADICHLIYKNYGTILPGTPKDLMGRNQLFEAKQQQQKDATAASLNGQKAKTAIDRTPVVQLPTQTLPSEQPALSIANLFPLLAASSSSAPTTMTPSKPTQTNAEQPLNLCLRDRSAEPAFTILSSDDDLDDGDDDDDDGPIHFSNVVVDSADHNHHLYSTLMPTHLNRPVATDSASPSSNHVDAMRMSLPNFQTALLHPNDNGGDDNSVPPDNVDPLPLSYYQTFVSAAEQLHSTSDAPATTTTTTKSSSSSSPITLSSSRPMSTNSGDGFLMHPSYHHHHHHNGEPIAKILIPRNISDLLKQHQHEQQKQQSQLQHRTTPTPPPPLTLSNSNQHHQQAASLPMPQRPPQPPIAAAKRKRSAIFIPPMPVDASAPGASTHPATEVSICKFKFTGGAKPSLQEKKMLSVDAGGNFRYYSGTGDKSTRGYEFFPRESLQQSASALQAAGAGHSAGSAFLSAASERMTGGVGVGGGSYGPMETTDVLAPPSLGLSNEVLQLSADQLPISPTTTNTTTRTLMPPPPTPPSGIAMQQSHNLFDQQHFAPHQSQLTNQTQRQSALPAAGRKSRRSQQRERLEKTFKEKGFLIQTQQLESAEGATYCKFRQLRKFTRYLFRSWKDYLPGELQQQQQRRPANPTMSMMSDDDEDDDGGGAGAGDGTTQPAAYIDDALPFASVGAESTADAATTAAGMQELILGESSSEHDCGKRRMRSSSSSSIDSGTTTMTTGE